MSPADGNLALQNALNGESEAAAEYARVLQTFTRLVVYGEEPEETLTIEALDPTPPTDPDSAG